MDSGKGILSFVVWPTYVGVALAGPTLSCDEPHNGGYQRGQISWTPVPDERQVVGQARIMVPPGEYTHFVYFHSPTSPQACGVVKMAHPFRCTELTTLDVDPITNTDLTLSQ